MPASWWYPPFRACSSAGRSRRCVLCVPRLDCWPLRVHGQELLVGPPGRDLIHVEPVPLLLLVHRLVFQVLLGPEEGPPPQACAVLEGLHGVRPRVAHYSLVSGALVQVLELPERLPERGAVVPVARENRAVDRQRAGGPTVIVQDAWLVPDNKLLPDVRRIPCFGVRVCPGVLVCVVAADGPDKLPVPNERAARYDARVQALPHELVEVVQEDRRGDLFEDKIGRAALEKNAGSRSTPTSGLPPTNCTTFSMPVKSRNPSCCRRSSNATTSCRKVLQKSAHCPSRDACALSKKVRSLNSKRWLKNQSIVGKAWSISHFRGGITPIVKSS